MHSVRWIRSTVHLSINSTYCTQYLLLFVKPQQWIGSEVSYDVWETDRHNVGFIVIMGFVIESVIPSCLMCFLICCHVCAHRAAVRLLLLCKSTSFFMFSDIPYRDENKTHPFSRHTVIITVCCNDLIKHHTKGTFFTSSLKNLHYWHHLFYNKRHVAGTLHSVYWWPDKGNVSEGSKMPLRLCRHHRSPCIHCVCREYRPHPLLYPCFQTDGPLSDPNPSDEVLLRCH